MFTVFGFYKFKKLNLLKKKKAILQNYFIKHDVRGTLIISKEGLNGTISGKSKNVSLIKKKIKNLFKKFKIDIVIHFAAQAGVRYSLVNPKSYFESNVDGFLNIIDISQQNRVKKFIFASSSSVYGDKQNFPLNEKEEINPKNIYSASKKLNEDIARDLSRTSKMGIIGLRFFTIYGTWSRPDMFIFKFLNATFNKKIFYLNNFGKHVRDFTHISDVLIIINKLIKKNFYNKFDILNVCSNKPINLSELIMKINKLTQINTKIIKIERNQIEVLKTHGDNKKIRNYLKLKKFKNILDEIENIIEWYKSEKIWKIKIN